MTQIKDMTDQQLKDRLGVAMGWMIRHKPIGCECDDVDEWWHDGTKFVREYEYWNPSTDPAASLEVQAKAIEANYIKYVSSLCDILDGESDEMSGELSPEAVADMLTASPRERAEAAYITLSSVKE